MLVVDTVCTSFPGLRTALQSNGIDQRASKSHIYIAPSREIAHLTAISPFHVEYTRLDLRRCM